VDGYWDYAFANRGLLYCPVRFNSGVCFQPGFCYTPTVCLDTNSVFDFLFCWPRYHHYCFGDFYAGTWPGNGIYPWCNFGRSRFGWDPVFAFERSRHVHDPGWSQNLAADWSFRREHAEARPPLTFAAQQQQFAGGRINGAQRLARPINEIARTNTGLRLESVGRDRQQQALGHVAELRRFQSDRITRETHAAGNLVPQSSGAASVSLPKTSPVVRSDIPRIVEHAGTVNSLPRRDVIAHGDPGRETQRRDLQRMDAERRQVIPQTQQTVHPPTRSPAPSLPAVQPRVNKSIEHGATGQSHWDPSNNAGIRQHSVITPPNTQHAATVRQSQQATAQYHPHVEQNRSRPMVSSVPHHAQPAASNAREKHKK
jgi:hypothetical protein